MTSGAARLAAVRPALVWLHRWAGLLMLAFLLVEAVTGSILAFEGPIGRWLDPPAALPPEEARLPPLDLASLAAAADSAEPRAMAAYFRSTGPGVAVVRVLPRIDPRTGKPYELGITDILLDVRSGREVGREPPASDTRPLAARVVPFIKDLHYKLALGDSGGWIFFFVALAWTLDCLLSVVLTLPAGARRFWRRWQPAWRVKPGAHGYRLHFDLHRAGGLWFLPVLFVFAWSSVELEEHLDVYDRVMSAIFGSPGIETAYASWPWHPRDVPLKLDWFAAQQRGAALMREKARRQGFRILAPTNLVQFVDNGMYNYSVRTDRSFPEHVEETVFLDGNTGEEIEPPGLRGETVSVVSDWLRALHMAVDPVDYLPYRIFVCAFGVVLSTLTVTGIEIWLRKRRGRARVAAR